MPTESEFKIWGFFRTANILAAGLLFLTACANGTGGQQKSSIPPPSALSLFHFYVTGEGNMDQADLIRAIKSTRSDVRQAALLAISRKPYSTLSKEIRDFLFGAQKSVDSVERLLAKRALQKFSEEDSPKTPSFDLVLAVFVEARSAKKFAYSPNVICSIPQLVTERTMEFGYVRQFKRHMGNEGYLILLPPQTLPPLKETEQIQKIDENTKLVFYHSRSTNIYVTVLTPTKNRAALIAQVKGITESNGKISFHSISIEFPNGVVASRNGLRSGENNVIHSLGGQGIADTCAMNYLVSVVNR